MASAASTTSVPVDIARVTINGCSAPAHGLDEATCLLGQAHGVMSYFNAHQSECPDLATPAIGETMLHAVETLLELGIRNLIAGHSALLMERAS